MRAFFRSAVVFGRAWNLGMPCAAALLAGSLWALSGETHVQSLPFQPGDMLQIRNNSGSVTVQSWDEEQVEARWRVWPPAGSDSPRVHFRRRGARLFLHSYLYGTAGQRVDLTVRVPPSIGLEVRAIQSEVTVEGLEGDVDVATLRGQVTLLDTTSTVSVFSRAGDILHRLEVQPLGSIQLVTDEGSIRSFLSPRLRLGLRADAAGRLLLDGAPAEGVLDGCPPPDAGTVPCLTLLSRRGDVELQRRPDAAASAPEPGEPRPPERRVRTTTPQLRTDPPPSPPAPRREAAAGEASSGEAADRPPRVPTFSVDVDWVHLNVIVQDRRSGRRISGLEIPQFEVREEGVPQEIQSLLRTEAPLSLLILLDVSGSTRAFLGRLKKAVRQFLGQLREEDRIGLIAFNRTPTLVHEYSSDLGSLGRSLRSLESGGGTNFYRALEYALGRLEGAGPRKALVVFTDGVDDTLMGQFEEAANVTFEEVFEDVQETDGLVYTIFLDAEGEFQRQLAGKGEQLLPDSVFAEARRQLQAISEHSGTPLYTPTRVDELSAIFAKIAADLRSQYTLAYSPHDTSRDGRWRRLRVRIPGRPDWAARTRKGYYAPGPREGRP